MSRGRRNAFKSESRRKWEREQELNRQHEKHKQLCIARYNEEQRRRRERERMPRRSQESDSGSSRSSEDRKHPKSNPPEVTPRKEDKKARKTSREREIETAFKTWMAGYQMGLAARTEDSASKTEQGDQKSRKSEKGSSKADRQQSRTVAQNEPIESTSRQPDPHPALPREPVAGPSTHADNRDRRRSQSREHRSSHRREAGTSHRRNPPSRNSEHRHSREGGPSHRRDHRSSQIRDHRRSPSRDRRSSRSRNDRSSNRDRRPSHERVSHRSRSRDRPVSRSGHGDRSGRPHREQAVAAPRPPNTTGRGYPVPYPYSVRYSPPDDIHFPPPFPHYPYGPLDPNSIQIQWPAVDGRGRPLPRFRPRQPYPMTRPPPPGTFRMGGPYRYPPYPQQPPPYDPYQGSLYFPAYGGPRGGGHWNQ